MNEKNLWEAVLAELYTTLSTGEYNTFFQRTFAKNLTEDSIDVYCENKYVIDMIQKRHYSLLQSSLTKIAKKSLEVNFKLGTKQKEEPDEKREEEKRGPLFESLIKPTENFAAQTQAHKEAMLNPNFTFENYIMGSNNRLAYSIASAVAESPGTVYNPFFIYSGVGLGKTHLMQAIGNQILKKSPSSKVMYCTSETFTNDLIEALQSGRTRGRYASNKFREKYRKVDVLLVDDIQFIIGKESTQEEFFHTFNTLQMSQKQIVITSDRPPKDFTQIEERIKSRFGSGIIADIQSPDLETRIAILRNKRDINGDDIPNEVIDFIAEHIDTNIRELEGSYLQVVTYSRTQDKALSLDTAREALNEKIQLQQPKALNLNQILKAVASYYSVKTTDIKGKRRTKDIVVPRQMSMYLMHKLTETPYVSIGEFLGGRDHTTIMHGVRKVEDEVETFGKAKQDLLNIKQLMRVESV